MVAALGFFSQYAATGKGPVQNLLDHVRGRAPVCVGGVPQGLQPRDRVTRRVQEGCWWGGGNGEPKGYGRSLADPPRGPPVVWGACALRN